MHETEYRSLISHFFEGFPAITIKSFSHLNRPVFDVTILRKSPSIRTSNALILLFYADYHLATKAEKKNLNHPDDENYVY